MAGRWKLILAGAMSGLFALTVFAFGSGRYVALAAPTGASVNTTSISSGQTVQVTASFNNDEVGAIVSANPVNTSVGAISLLSCSVGGSPCAGLSPSGSGGAYIISDGQMINLNSDTIAQSVVIIVGFQIFCSVNGGSMSFTATQGTSLITQTVFCNPTISICVDQPLTPGCLVPNCLTNPFLPGCFPTVSVSPATVTVTGPSQVVCAGTATFTVTARTSLGGAIVTGTPATISATQGSIGGGTLSNGVMLTTYQAPTSGQGGQVVITAYVGGVPGSASIFVLPCQQIAGVTNVPVATAPIPAPAPVPVTVAPVVRPPAAGSGGLK